MYGTNKVTAINRQHSGDELNVFEIFESIQGEGLYTGRPAIFIRLAGCCNQCSFCDTDFENAIPNMYSVDSLVSEVVERAAGLVVITGGEPLIQNIAPFIDALYFLNYEVQIETSGAVFEQEWFKNKEWFIPYKHGIEKKVTFVCSPKTKKVANSLAPYVDCWKYVVSPIGADVDGLPMISATTSQLQKTVPIQKPLNTAPIYVQPCDVRDPEQKLKNIAFAIAIVTLYGYRLSLQLHKILGLQ